VLSLALAVLAGARCMGGGISRSRDQYSSGHCRKTPSEYKFSPFVNVATGVARGKVTKIIPGNAEKLTPGY
jgi:hypothetical protein